MTPLERWFVRWLPRIIAAWLLLVLAAGAVGAWLGAVAALR